jgi:hypothetical protein
MHRGVARDNDLAIDVADQKQPLPRQVGKVFDDYIAVNAALVGNLPDRAWLSL